MFGFSFNVWIKHVLSSTKRRMSEYCMLVCLCVCLLAPKNKCMLAYNLKTKPFSSWQLAWGYTTISLITSSCHFFKFEIHLVLKFLTWPFFFFKYFFFRGLGRIKFLLSFLISFFYSHVFTYNLFFQINLVLLYYLAAKIYQFW